MTAELHQMLDELIPKLRKGLADKFPSVSREDVEQACWLGCLEHADQLEAKLQEDPRRAGDDARQYCIKEVLKLARQEERQARTVKAMKAQYSPQDEAFYSVGLLEQLLPPYLDNGVTAEPPKGREQYQPGNSDPAESGNWLAMMLDVDDAFNGVRNHHRDVLRRYFSYPQGSGGFTHLEIASAMGIPPTTLKDRVSRALRAMESRLGGRSPWRV